MNKPTTEITPAHLEAIIEFFGDRYEDCPCCRAICNSLNDKNCGHGFEKPILIGEVLEKMGKGGGKDKLRVVRFWEDFGESISLQEIFKEAWVELKCVDPRVEGSIRVDKKLKEPVEQLARLLIEIFNIQVK